MYDARLALIIRLTRHFDNPTQTNIKNQKKQKETDHQAKAQQFRNHLTRAILNRCTPETETYFWSVLFKILYFKKKNIFNSKF